LAARLMPAPGRFARRIPARRSAAFLPLHTLQGEGCPLTRATMAERLVRALDLPLEGVLDLPKMTLIGNFQALVENHRGLLAYDPRLIRIRTAKGELVIAGAGLRIASILPKELVVEGHIVQVELRR